jgi:hypothetical protein
MKTLAQLKRDAKTGKLSGEMIVRFGKTEIPERLKGIRPIVDANTVSIKFQNADGKKSDLPIECASLVEYDDVNMLLTIYSAGYRELTADEQRIKDEWQEVCSTEKYKNQAHTDIISDGSQTYYQKKYFFEDRGYGYLMGYKKEKGMIFDSNTGKVKDNKIKGNIELQYKLHNK